MRIYDGNNQARIWWESSPSGFPMRDIEMEANLTGEPRIYVWDGMKANSRRREIFPDYKSKKVAAPDDFYQTVREIKKLLLHTNALQVEIPGYEGDDVIASIVKTWPRDEHCFIASTDRDLRQLLVLPNVSVSSTPLEGVKDHEIHLYKAWVGDSSDSIPGVDGFGKKSWFKADTRLLQLFIENDSMPVESITMFLSRRSYNWLSVQSNRERLKQMYRCIDLIDIPTDVLAKHIQWGKRDAVKAQQIKDRFFQ